MKRAACGAKSTLGIILIAVLLALSFSGFAGCGGSPAATKVEPQPTIEELQAEYLAAVDDAVVALPDEISRDLTAVVPWEEDLEWEGVPGDSRVKVLVWTSKNYYDSYIGRDYQLPVDANVWVTLAPELEERFTGEEATLEPSELRAKQLLGLPPDGSYSKFVELWVNPPYTGDHPYPWTGLGYTYDWGNTDSEIGLSEFVILGGSTVGVDAVIPTEEYLNN